MAKTSKKDEEKLRNAVAKEVGIRRLSPKEADVMANVMSLIEQAQITMGEFGGRPPSREFALALTKLEEAEMWVERGFDVDEGNEEQIDEIIAEKNGETDDSDTDDDTAEADDDE
jgi:hypothetical protein